MLSGMSWKWLKCTHLGELHATEASHCAVSTGEAGKEPLESEQRGVGMVRPKCELEIKMPFSSAYCRQSDVPLHL